MSWRCLSGSVNEMLKIRKPAVITIIILTFADVKVKLIGDLIMETDIFLKVIRTSDEGETMTACYPTDTIEAAREAFEGVKDRFKELNDKFLKDGFAATEEEDSFEVFDRHTKFNFCIEIVEQPRMSAPAIIEELELDGFFY